MNLTPVANWLHMATVLEARSAVLATHLSGWDRFTPEERDYVAGRVADDENRHARYFRRVLQELGTPKTVDWPPQDWNIPYDVLLYRTARFESIFSRARTLRPMCLILDRVGLSSAVPEMVALLKDEGDHCRFYQGVIRRLRGEGIPFERGTILKNSTWFKQVSPVFKDARDAVGA
jgi:hypothetical protein